jgi:hypothetical protein
MTTTRYIILRNSTEQAAYIGNPNVFQGHKYPVIMEGYKPTLTKNESVDRAVDGTLDMTIGSITFTTQLVLRCRETATTDEATANYGTLGDLETYYKLNDPGGSPTNVITLVDHFGTAHTGFLVGDYAPQPLTTIISGEDASFFVAIQFMEKAAIA